MASDEEYIRKLEEYGLSKEEIDRKVKETISNMKGWIDEKTALFVVAKELGLAVDPQAIKYSSEQDYTISQLSESTQNVNVVGRVVNFSDVRSFGRKDGTKGQFSSFQLYDGKDQIKVVIWDDRANIVKDNSFTNDILVRILNGQVKFNRDKHLEIHIGSRSDIEINPSDISPSDFPSLDYSKFRVKISEIVPVSPINKDMISIEGKVEQVFSKRSVKSRSTDEDLYVQRILVKDSTGTIPVVFWNKDTELIENLQEGATVSLENLNAKTQYNDENKMELTYKNGSHIKILKKGIVPKQIPIKNVGLDLSRVSIVGDLALKNDIRTFTRKKDNSEGRYQRIQVQDSTGSIGVVFWEEDVNQLEKVDVGYKIKLENVGVQQDFRESGKPELVFRTSSTFTIVNNSNSSTLDSITPIKELLDKEGVYSIEGQIIKITDPLKSITTTDGRTLKLFAIHLSDNTGAIQLTFWEDQAENYADLKVGDTIKVVRVIVKKNIRLDINTASFGNSSQLKRNHDFELTETHKVPEFYTQTQDNPSLDRITPINNVLEQEGYYTIEGQITQIGDDLKTITTSDGRSLIIFSVHLSDNTGAIQLTFWEDQAEKYADLNVGENIKAVGVNVKFNSRMGINTASFGRNSQLERNIIFDLKEQHELPSVARSQSAKSVQLSGKYTPIEQIVEPGLYEIKGNVSDVKRISVYEACAKCLKNISNDKNNCICEEGPEQSVVRMIISAIFNDGTGDLAVTFFGDKAEQLIHQESVTIQVKKQDSNYLEFEKEIVDNLKAKDIALIGHVSPNTYSQENEMKVNEFKILNIEDNDSIDELIDDIER